MNIKNIGRKIRSLRQHKEWSQEHMAKQLKISIPAFSKIETGITDLTLSRLKQIAELFGLTIIQLIMQGEESELKYSSELLAVQERLHQREAEVTALQKKVIDLFEELRSRASA